MKSGTALVDQIKTVIEQVTFTNLGDVDIAVDLEDALGIDMETDFPRIVKELCRRFFLSRETEELLLEATTLKQLVDIVREETELG